MMTNKNKIEIDRPDTSRPVGPGLYRVFFAYSVLRAGSEYTLNEERAADAVRERIAEGDQAWLRCSDVSSTVALSWGVTLEEIRADRAARARR